MKKLDSIKKPASFNHLQKFGIKYVCPYFIIIFAERLEEGKDQYLLGLKVSKKVGNAVKRNFVKRRYRALMREFTQMNQDNFFLNKYYLFIGRTQALNAEFTDIKAEFEKAIQFFC